MIGVTTAHALASAGHTVTVMDRQPGPALETSFANGGQISACHAAPWATPSMPFRAFSLMFQSDAPLRINPMRWDPALWGWCLRFLANCTASRFERNLERALRVATYSRTVLKALRQRHNLKYDHTTGGLLYLYRDAETFAEAQKLAEKLSDRGLTQVHLDRDGVLGEEPSLALSQDPITGGILSPDDETGDAHAFTQELMAVTQAQGVAFRFDTTIMGLKAGDRNIAYIETESGSVPVDAVVVCMGSDTAPLLAQIGLKVPIYPAKGYSLTGEIIDPGAAPKRSITDESRFMVITRMGNRLRSGGTAELAGYNRDIKPNRMAPIVAGTQVLFPKAVDYQKITPWTGLRPATPDSVPIVGATRYENLFINAGHGTLGWTMAAGSAQLVADLITGRTPEIDPEGLGLDRFKS